MLSQMLVLTAAVVSFRSLTGQHRDEDVEEEVVRAVRHVPVLLQR